MTPNLLLATQTLFSPHKWFKHQRSERSTRTTEHWNDPVPGIYEYIPGRGWYLIATDKEASSTSDSDLSTPSSTSTPTPKNPNPSGTKTETVRMTTPIQAIYSKVLKRYLLAPDYSMRKRTVRLPTSTPGKFSTSGFFQLDDGTAWVQCWDSRGEFIPGPYKLWCQDQTTGHFRHMLRGDDPNYVPSRQNSIESDSAAANGSTGPASIRRRSQDSRSTQFRGGVGPDGSRDGPSVPSTRANSVIRQQLVSPPPSHPGSRAGSRRNSPKRSGSYAPLEEAKVRLREMAREQVQLDFGAAIGNVERVREEEAQNRGRTSEKEVDAVTVRHIAVV